MKSVGIVGFGSFGRFMAGHLKPFFEIAVYDRRDVREAVREVGVRAVPLEEAAAQEVVVLAVPVQNLGTVLQEIGSRVAPSTLVVDVASVKVKPLQLMEKYLEERVEILGTHPMFGPQSGRHGIEGLKIVLCPLRTTRLEKIRRFLTTELKLQVLEMPPERHDAEMAYIQGLTHWIAKALREVRVPDMELSTPAYRHLLQIEEILREDSLDLFLTIERENPFAGSARRELLAKLKEIAQLIDKG